MGVPLDKKPPPNYGAHDILKILLNPRIDFERITIVSQLKLPTMIVMIVQCAQGRQIGRHVCM